VLDWDEARRHLTRVAGFVSCWALAILVLEGIVAPFGPLRRSFPIYGVAVPIGALTVIVLAFWRGWLWMGLPGEESASRRRFTAHAKRASP
jgi:hypothetical protein